MAIEQVINDIQAAGKQQAVPAAIININAVAPALIPAAQTVLNPPDVFSLARAIFTQRPQPLAPVTPETPQLPTTLVTTMDSVGSSQFGLPVYANIEFQGGEWLDFAGRRRQYPLITVILSPRKNKGLSPLPMFILVPNSGTSFPFKSLATTFFGITTVALFVRFSHPELHSNLLT